MDRKRTAFWRWLAVGLLAAAAIPLLWSRRAPETPARPAAVDASQWTVPGEIVVKLRDTAAPSDIASLAGRLGVSFVDDYPAVNPGHVERIVTAPALAPALLARLRTDPLVEAAEPQRLFRLLWTPNDPRFGEQWNMKRIHAEKAWDITRGAGAVVAVIDTGVAFESDGVRCYRCKDFDRTRFVAPYDFVHRDKHPMDDHGHGTHVAGTIAESTDNGEGVAGIAFEATVMPLKVLSREGYGRLSDVAAAIRYAADHGANVINMSLGGPFPDAISRSACKYAHDKGVTIVCAAGNTGHEGVGYPAAYPECIAVSALGPTGDLAFYSSWGKQVAISAPGGDKRQSPAGGILQNTFFAGPQEAGAGAGAGAALEAAGPAAPGEQVDGYYSFQGTSMATPHVAGVAALVVSQGVKDPDEVKAVLEATAQARGPREKFGAGELDAAAAAHRAWAIHTEYAGRLALLGVVWAFALLAGRGRRRRGLPAWGAAVAASLGLLLPDFFGVAAGYNSVLNLFGHSVLLPGFLLVAEAESAAERRFYGLFAAGLVVHLGMDLANGSLPVLGQIPWAAIPWLWANVLVGIGTIVAGFRPSRA